MFIRKPLLFFCVLIFTFVSSGQENLVPNGDFESGNYNGGSDPTNYYSGGDNTVNTSSMLLPFLKWS